MKKIIILALLTMFLANHISMASSLDDETLKGIEKINEIMFLVSNFYVESRGVEDIFMGATLGMIRSLGAGAQIFNDLSDYEHHLYIQRNIMKFGATFNQRRGFHQVVSVYEHGILSSLELMPGDTLYSIGNLYLDNLETIDLVFLLYQAMLSEEDLMLTIRRVNLDMPLEINLNTDPDYSAYNLKESRIKEIESSILNNHFDMSIFSDFELKEEHLIEHIVLNNLSIIRINTINKEIFPLFIKYVKQANKSSKVIALDLRRAVGINMNDIESFLSIFLTNEYIGYYELNSGKKEKLYIDLNEDFTNKLPIAVFVSRQTYWYAEYFAQLLKDHISAYIIGENTFGRGDYKELYSLLDNRFYMLISTGILYSQKNRTTFQKGLKPDKEIKPEDLLYSAEEYKLLMNAAQEKISYLISSDNMI